MEINKERNVLPFSIPMEMTWQSQSILIAILNQSKKAYSWIMNYYIQYYCERIREPEYKHPYACLVPGINNSENILSCPFVETKMVSRDEMKNNWNAISDFLIDSIDNNCYIQIDLDQHGIWSDDIEVGAFIHGNFFYGYDKENRKFYIADHFNDGKFDTKEVDFDNVDKGFEAISNNDDYKDARLLKTKDIDYKFDYEIMKGFFKDLLNSENTYTGYEYFIHNHDVLLGLSTYDNYIKYAENVELKYKNYFDRRSFTILLNHKELMVKRLEYLKENMDESKSNMMDEFIVAYSEIYENVRTILFTAIKYNCVHVDVILSRLIKLLKTTKEKERVVLESIVSSLDVIISNINQVH